MLIHKYECNDNLASFLFDEGEKLLVLDCKRRYCIYFGIAKGLVCIHVQSGMHIAHRHIKPDNILLDENFNPNMTDFSTSKMASYFNPKLTKFDLRELMRDDISHLSTVVIGTFYWNGSAR